VEDPEATAHDYVQRTLTSDRFPAISAPIGNRISVTGLTNLVADFEALWGFHVE